MELEAENVKNILKITAKFEQCGAVVTNYVKRIYKGANYAKTNEDGKRL